MIMKKLFELAERKGYKVHNKRVLSNHPEYISETIREQDIVQELALLQLWLRHRNYFALPMLLMLLEPEAGWGYELTYRKDGEWHNTDENRNYDSYSTALEAVLEHALTKL